MFSRLAVQAMVVVAAILAVSTIPTEAQELPPLKLVDQVDLDRYAGLWYEAARVPNPFQDQCVRNVTAEYRLRDDGRIDVINRCEKKDGSFDRSKGLARILPRQLLSGFYGQPTSACLKSYEL